MQRRLHSNVAWRQPDIHVGSLPTTHTIFGVGQLGVGLPVHRARTLIYSCRQPRRPTRNNQYDPGARQSCTCTILRSFFRGCTVTGPYASWSGQALSVRRRCEKMGETVLSVVGAWGMYPSGTAVCQYREQSCMHAFIYAWTQSLLSFAVQSSTSSSTPAPRTPLTHATPGTA